MLHHPGPLTHGPPLMHHQVFQDPRFLQRGSEREASACCPLTAGTGAGVEAQLRLSDTSCWVNCRNVEVCRDAGLQLRQVEGLCQIVVRPGIQPLHLVLQGGFSAPPVVLGTRRRVRADRHAVLFRRGIKKHQVVSFGHAQRRQRLFSVIRSRSPRSYRRRRSGTDGLAPASSPSVVHAVGQPPQAADDGLAQGAFIFNY